MTSCRMFLADSITAETSHKQEAGATLKGLTVTLHKRQLGPQPRNLPCTHLDLPTRKIITLPESPLRQIMRVKGRRVPEQILWDILPPLQQHLITTPTIPNAVIPRIETPNAGTRSIMTGGRVARLMPRSRETREVVR